MQDEVVVVAGGGVMGGTLTAGLMKAGWRSVVVVERDDERAAALHDELGVEVVATLAEAPTPDVLLIAVKPNVVGEVLDEAGPLLAPGALVVSVAAGVPLRFYHDGLPVGVPVVRVMPNTPALVGKGASAIAAGRHVEEEHLQLVEAMLAATGLVVRVAEKDLDAVTAISGSGPAYAFYLIDAMAEAGVLLGLTRDLATRLAVATVEGSAALAAGGEHPVLLRERVSSPGGTTVAAVAQLDAHGVRAGVVAAARAAAERSAQLGAAHAPHHP